MSREKRFVALGLSLLLGCAATAGAKMTGAVSIAIQAPSVSDPAAVLAVLRNGTAEPVYLDPARSKPAGVCEMRDEYGNWVEVGSLYPSRVEANAWLDSIRVAPGEQIRLSVDCDVVDRFDVAAEHAIILDWLRHNDRESHAGFTDAPPPVFREPIHGEFRIRASYLDRVWHFQEEEPEARQQVASKPFRIETESNNYLSRPEPEELKRNRSRWEALDLDRFTLYWRNPREYGRCRRVFLEFADGELVAESSHYSGDMTPAGCCEDDSAACMESFSKLVEERFADLEAILADETGPLHVGFDPSSGLPSQVLYRPHPTPELLSPSFGGHSLLLLVAPYPPTDASEP